MKRDDLKSVMRMQKMSGEFSKNHTQEFINKNNAICSVVEVEGKVVGFIFYEIDASSIEIDSLLVDTAFRRRGIGTELLSKLIAKLNKKRREITEVIKNSEASDYLFSFSSPIKK
jgi:ribosomal protein S18 acetylase RimI-like enzyme